jgi:phage FluMu protein Com
MAIFRCNKCGHIREVGNDYLGKSVKCPRCEQITTIHDTITYLKALIKKHIAQSKELQNLRQDSSGNDSVNEIAENITFEEIDIYNTNILTHANNLEPVLQWFEKRKIEIYANPDTVDTTGFFDEIALLIGENYNVLNVVTNQIKYLQNKGYTNVKIELSKKEPREIQQITSFCKALYEYSFVAKYYYQKKDKVIRLALQKAPKIREFFNGIWMEWYTLMKLLEFFREQKVAPACTRGLKISFTGGNSNELDLFVLTEKKVPICVECKTGEFRQDIDKYLSLRKQLNINKNQFVICVFGLSQEQAQGMTSMYDLTFVNETSLIQHIQTVV